RRLHARRRARVDARAWLRAARSSRLVTRSQLAGIGYFARFTRATQVAEHLRALAQTSTAGLERHANHTRQKLCRLDGAMHEQGDDDVGLGAPPEPDVLARALRRSRIANELFGTNEV